MKHIIIGIAIVFLTQGLIWFQAYSQFFWDFSKRNPLIIALIGFPVSYLTILSTKYFYSGFDGLLWPGRFVGFACGILVFSALSYYIMQENFSPKTMISLSLAIMILMVQMFYK